MADPNTQIDWWIAQTWQEAQGGAANDALVAWLHENGLTAPSSYTILQAALSCPPETAKEIVFGHPVWAGAEADSNLENLDYTNDTLEPEPEPDPAFELDDWAEQVEEEGPVYGEEGFQPDPNAGASPPAHTRKPVAPTDIGGSNMPEPAQPEAGDAAPETYPAMDVAEATPDEQIADPAPAPALAESAPAADPVEIVTETAPAEHHTDSAPAPVLETSAPATDPAEIVTEAAPVEQVAEPVSAATIDEPVIIEPAPPAATSEPVEGAGLPPQESPLDPAGQDMAASPPTPGTAETEPAEPAAAPPQPAMAAAPMPAPLVYRPLPEFQPLQPAAPAAPAAPLFALPQRDRQPAPPLFPPATAPQPAPDTASLPPVAASNGHDPDGMSALAVPEQELEVQLESTMENTGTLSAGAQAAMAHDEGGPQSDFAETVAEETVEMAPPESEQELPCQHTQVEQEAAQETEEAQAAEAYEESGVVEESPTPAMDDASDLPPGMLAAMGSADGEPQNELAEALDEDSDQPAPTDWEQELPPLDDDGEAEETVYLDDEHDTGDSPAMAEEAIGGDAEEGDDEENASRPRKQLLLDPADEAIEDELPGDTPEQLAAAARKLGIDFREGDQSDAGVDPDMAKAAKELGISFRKGGEAEPPLDDEAAIEARKLGISFREGDTTSAKPKKPMVVKYLPMLLGVIILFFLLLLGATFAGDFIGWLKS